MTTIKSDNTKTLRNIAQAADALGYVVVPKEPTEAMVDALTEPMDSTWGYPDKSIEAVWATEGYKAMIKAGAVKVE